MKRLLVVLILVATAAQGEIYTWKDSRGTAHYANRLDDIPPRYRNRARSLNYDAGKGGEGAQQPSGPALPPPPPPPGGGGATLQQGQPARPTGTAPELQPPSGAGTRPARSLRRGGASRHPDE